MGSSPASFVGEPLVFLSHSADDASEARQLAALLRELGVRVWLDLESLQPGDSWMRTLEQALTEADAFVAYIGASGVQRWVDREVRFALDRNTRDSGFRIISVLGPECRADLLPPFLIQHQYLQLETIDLNRNVAERILVGIKGTTTIEDRQLSGRVPFMGLEPFNTKDAAFFFGREVEIGRLLDELQRRRFLALVGNSGSGKTSLLCAGLIPSLLKGRFHDRGRWIYNWNIIVVRPGQDPVHSLALELAQSSPITSARERLQLAEELERQVLARPSGILDCVSVLFPRDSHTLLIVDQLEEVFTLADEAARNIFLDRLLAFADCVPDLHVHVVVALRADFYARCWEHERLRRALGGDHFALGLPGLLELRELINRRAALAGVAIESGLTERMLADLGLAPSSLPLLEFCLLALWERRDHNTLTHAAYDAIGGIPGALRNHADAVYSSFDSEGREITKRIFLLLVNVSEGCGDTKRRYRIRDLLYALREWRTPQNALDHLIRMRLLTASRDTDAPIVDHVDRRDLNLETDRAESVEIAHEILITDWPKVKEWISHNFEYLQANRQVSRATVDWLAFNRDPGLLLRGALLVRTQELVASKDLLLTQEEQHFLKESLAHQEREVTTLIWEASRARRRVRLLGALSVLVIICLAIAMVEYYRARAAAQVAVAQEVASRSIIETEVEVDPLKGLRLAIQAASTAKTLNTDDALRRALQAPRLHAVLDHVGHDFDPGKDRGITGGHFSPDGARFMMIGGDSASVWDCATGHLIVRIPGPRDGLWDADWSPDGNEVVTTDSTGLVRVWSSRNGQRLAGYQAQAGLVRVARFSPDGENIVSGGDDRTTHIVNWRTRKIDLSLETGPIYNARFSPNGRLVMTSGMDSTVRIWSALTGRQLIHVAGVACCIQNWEFSADSSRIGVGLQRGDVQIVDAITKNVIIDLDAPAQPEFVMGVTFSSDEGMVASVTNNSVRIWDLTSHQLLDVLKPRGRTNLAAFSPDSGTILTAGYDGTRLWDIRTSNLLATFGGLENDTRIAEFSPEGRWIAVASFMNGVSQLWDYQVRSELPSLADKSVVDAAYSPSANLVGTVSEDGAVKIWDDQTGRLVRNIGSIEGKFKSVGFEPLGQYIYARDFEGGGRVWDLNGRLVRSVSKEMRIVEIRRFPPNTSCAVLLEGKDHALTLTDIESGRTLLSLPLGSDLISYQSLDDWKTLFTAARDGTVTEWNVSTAEVIGKVKVHDGPIDDFWLSPNGQVSAVVTDFRTTAERYIVSTFPGLHPVWAETVGGFCCFKFGEDSQVFLVGAEKDGAKMIDIHSGAMLFEVFHGSTIYSADLSSDGARIATAGSDDKARLWDARRGVLLSVLSGHDKGVRKIAFRPDGNRVMTVGGDGVVRFYYVKEEDLLATAEQRLQLLNSSR